MAAESGTAGYNSPPNPISGAMGCYQVLPSHYLPGGSCEGLSQSPADQDACMRNICATEGNGAWAASGAAPC